MFNIFNFKFKKFDITSKQEYLDLQGQLLRLKNDVVSHQLLPKSVFDDAGNEFFLQIKTDEDMARISYKANKGPLEFMIAYGHDIPNAIKSIYKMGILSYVSKSRLRNPESDYELSSVKAYIDSFKEIDASKNPKFLTVEEAKELATYSDDLERAQQKVSWKLEPSPNGPVSEDDLINKGRVREIWGGKETGELKCIAKDITQVGEYVETDLPGKGGTKFTLTLNAKDFMNGYDELMEDAKNMANQDEVELTQEDLVKGLSEVLKDKKIEFLEILKNREKEFREKYGEMPHKEDTKLEMDKSKQHLASPENMESALNDWKALQTRNTKNKLWKK